MISAALTRNYGFDPQQCYDFTPYLHDLSGVHLHYGLGLHPYESAPGVLSVKLVVEHPNSIHITQPDCDLNLPEENTKYDIILNICPYSCAYLNERFGTTKYRDTFFPLAPAPYNETRLRDIPCYYSGSRISGTSIVNSITEVVHEVTGSAVVNRLNQSISVQSPSSYYRKMEIYNRTKICICHNVLIAPTIPGINAARSDPLYRKHFSWVAERKEYVPQIKSRMFEGAMMGCVLLVFKDEYNSTDRYFTENEDFLYFTDKNDLRRKVAMILENYDDYKYLAENAQSKYLSRYTFGHFIEKLKHIRDQTAGSSSTVTGFPASSH
jgi:hypothetical protein